MENNQKKGNKSKYWLFVFGFALIAIAIIIILLFLMVGKTDVTYSESGEDEVHSIACEAGNVPYPFFTYDNSESKKLKINATFKNDTLTSISLVYILTYVNKDEAKASELKNHIDFEVGIQNEGLTYASLNTDHKIMDNVYQLTMYNQGEELNRGTAKYYMLGSLREDFTQANIENAIAKSGLNCVNK